MNKFLFPLFLRDIKLFYLINNTLQCKLFNLVLPKITHLGSGLFLGVIIIFFILSTEDKLQQIGWEALLIVGVINLLVHFLKVIIKRSRPFNFLEDVNLLSSTFSLYSFPSGHSAAIFSFATVIYNHILVIGVLVYLLAIIVAFSRAYLGVHYPSDIIIGALLGVYLTKLIYFFL